MTREEARREIYKAFEPAFANYIITALEEGTTVSDRCEDKEPVLDQIRAEIQKLRNCSCSCSDGIIDDVEDIIDKYKESNG